MKRYANILCSLLCVLSVGAYFFLSSLPTEVSPDAEPTPTETRLQPDVALVKHFFQSARELREALGRAQ